MTALPGGAARGGENPRDETAAEAVAMASTPAALLERREPAPQKRCRPPDRLVQRRAVARDWRCEGRSLEQLRGPRWIRVNTRFRDDHAFHPLADPYDDDDGGFRSDRDGGTRPHRGG